MWGGIMCEANVGGGCGGAGSGRRMREIVGEGEVGVGMRGREGTCSEQGAGRGEARGVHEKECPVKTLATQCATAVEARPARAVFGGGGYLLGPTVQQAEAQRVRCLELTRSRFIQEEARSGTGKQWRGVVCVLVQKMNTFAQPHMRVHRGCARYAIDPARCAPRRALSLRLRQRPFPHSPPHLRMEQSLPW